MELSRKEKLSFVNKSPESVAVHDKASWLSIFSRRAVVEDPVGSQPHINGLIDKKRNKTIGSSLSSFYDTFIEPNEIAFDVKNDIVCDNHVIRDLTVNINMDGINVSVPMHLLYELTQEKGEPKIKRLAAHWELIPMAKVLLSKGISAAPILTAMSSRMLKNQGLGGAIGFTKGVGKLGEKHKRLVDRFESAFNHKSVAELSELLGPSADIYAPYGSCITQPSELLSTMSGSIRFTKCLTAGSVISASFNYRPDSSVADINGVALFEFDHAKKKIACLTFYFET